MIKIKLLAIMSLGANGSVKTKRAAMFGLDARIALAIFGALSVISGAALYSAIQKAKLISYIQSFEAMAKAEESFYIDTGVVKEIIGKDEVLYNTDDIPGSNAPYVGNKSRYIINNASPIYLQPFSDLYRAAGGIGGMPWAQFRSRLKTTSDWVSEDDEANQCVIGDSDCSRYVEAYLVGAISGINLVDFQPNIKARVKYQEIFDKLDDMIDGGDGKLQGKLRASLVVDDPYAGIFYQYRPQKRTN